MSLISLFAVVFRTVSLRGVSVGCSPENHTSVCKGWGLGAGGSRATKGPRCGPNLPAPTYATRLVLNSISARLPDSEQSVLAPAVGKQVLLQTGGYTPDGAHQVLEHKLVCAEVVDLQPKLRAYCDTCAVLIEREVDYAVAAHVSCRKWGWEGGVLLAQTVSITHELL